MVLHSVKQPMIEAEANVTPGPELEKYAPHSFGAQFSEVAVDRDTGEIRLRRHVAVFDIGRVMNAKTARSQAMGGITMGIGMALSEQTVYDHEHGRPVTNNLADYAVPVNADVPNIDVTFVDYPDLIVSPLGARGVGEIGITGVAPAIANAIYHATGIRVRDNPDHAGQAPGRTLRRGVRLRLPTVQSPQLRFGGGEHALAFGRQRFAGTVNIEIQHRHRRLERGPLAAAALFGGALERSGNASRTARGEHARLKIECVAGCCDPLGPPCG
jgi:hypothetical protein